MSEQMSHTSAHLHEVVSALAMAHGGRYVETHLRFSLGLNGGLDVVITDPETGGRDRLLVTQESPGDMEVYDKLAAAGVPQLTRSVQADGVAMYRLPFQAKPLSRERLFVEHSSSSTYVSDVELFAGVGNLWHKVYAVTGQLPASDVLSSTVVLDFKDMSETLVPTPPYSSWLPITDQAAAVQHIEAVVAEELQGMNPHISHGPLLDAMTTGWHHGATH